MMNQIFYNAFVDELDKLAADKPKAAAKKKPAKPDGVKVTVNVGKDDKKKSPGAGEGTPAPVVTDEHRNQVEKVQEKSDKMYKDLLKRKPPPRLTDITAEEHFKHKATLKNYASWLSQKMEADKSS